MVINAFMHEEHVRIHQTASEKRVKVELIKVFHPFPDCFYFTGAA